jgi:hypothetical protein
VAADMFQRILNSPYASILKIRQKSFIVVGEYGRYLGTVPLPSQGGLGGPVENFGMHVW